MRDMRPDIDRLTRALRELQNNPPVPCVVPKTILLSELKLSPEVQKFLDMREEYRKKCDKINLDYELT